MAGDSWGALISFRRTADSSRRKAALRNDKPTSILFLTALATLEKRVVQVESIHSCTHSLHEVAGREFMLFCVESVGAVLRFGDLGRG